MRRVARLGDGWLASAYHITPASFADTLARLNHPLHQVGREPEGFPHALGSMFYYLTEDRRLAEELLVEVVSPTLGRPVELLLEKLPIGTPAECAEKLLKLQAAGVRKVFLWPVANEASQLARFHSRRKYSPRMDCGCLLFFRMRSMSFAQHFRRTLLPGAIVCLIAIGLFSSLINLKREGESGRDQRNGFVSYWHIRSPTELGQDSVPPT